MEALSPAEWIVAKEYCKGLVDKEVAENLQKSILTTKTQKRSIYRKLGISKDTELVLYMICMKLGRDFDLKELRKHGLELLLSALFVTMQITCNYIDMRSMSTSSRTHTAVRSGARFGRRNNELDLSTMI